VKLNREFGKVKKYLLSWADLDFADLSLYFANNESIKAYFLETVVRVQIQFGAYFYRCLSLFISPVNLVRKKMNKIKTKSSRCKPHFLGGMIMSVRT